MFEMVQAFGSGFLLIFDPTTFSLMLLGIGIGFAVGILPGLGGPAALALMLPFIVKMKAVEAFAFLLGMASVTNTTGDITSILFGVPGESSSAATIVDGHPMAKKGEAGRALGAALMSSLVGAIFGAFALALAIPIVRPLVLILGSPEFFMLAILGVTFVASLSGGSLLKGLIGGGVGLFLATIGLDPISGVPRFTFGQLFLWDGIGLVPITIGFFALPEVIDLAVQGSSIARGEVGKLGGVKEGIQDTFRHWWMVIRCSAIGTLTGIIPGMGPATTQWLAYAHAVQSSADKGRFGKGAVEGVLGPGAANNSSLGGLLVTTIAFGVPTSVMMAILLGAFLIHGLIPGADMLIPELKGGHLALTFSFVWTIVFSNIITVAVCFIFLKQLVKVTRIRGSLLIPLILLLIYLGAFTEKNAIEDLLLVFLFGILGWIMQWLRWPRPPLILGLVLGPLAENRLFLSTDNYGLAWLGRPGVLVLIALALGGVFYSVLRTKRSRAARRDEPVPAPETAVAGGFPKMTRSTLFSLFITAGLALALWQSRRFNFRSGLFPWTICGSVFILSIFQFGRDLMGKKEKGGMESQAEAGQEILPHLVRSRTMGTFGWFGGFLATVWLLGFSAAGPLSVFLYLKITSREKWPLTLILTLGTWVFLYGIFDLALHVPFPAGKLYAWLSF